MRVCWFGIYDREYSRNSVLIDGLKKSGVEVVECNYTGSGFKKYFKLIKQLRSLNNQYDVLVCAFPVHISILLAWLFQPKPIIADAFNSKHDSEIHDRQKFSAFSLQSTWFWLLDRLIIWLADGMFVDTKEHKQFWLKKSARKKVHVIPVGFHTKEFFPQDNQKNKKGQFLVQFHGSYIPLQGAEKIVEAAHILRDHPNIVFRMIGSGQTYQSVLDRIDALQVQSISLLPWQSIAELNNLLNEAHVILGIFGDSEKAKRVVPNKVYQGLAVKKPVITRDSVAARTLFTDNELYLIDANPEAIAAAILDLYEDYSDTREKYNALAQNGYCKGLTMSETRLGEQVREILQSYTS